MDYVDQHPAMRAKAEEYASLRRRAEGAAKELRAMVWNVERGLAPTADLFPRPRPLTVADLFGLSLHHPIAPEGAP